MIHKTLGERFSLPLFFVLFFARHKLSTTEGGYILYTDGNLVSLIAYTGLETDLTLPSGIVEIYQYAFYGCSDLTSVTIDNSLFLIGNYAFYNCNGLKIIFKGTRAEWNAVYKGSNWRPSSATVTCIGIEGA